MNRHIRVAPPRGGLIHVTSEGAATMGRTYCGRKTDGWIVVDGAPGCVRCLRKLAVEMKP